MTSMCGICGATSDGAGTITRRMMDRMVHRGPDDEGIHIDPGAAVALGARRLSIIDVAAGHQPVGNEDGTVWAVLNGEIYNHPELQKHLRARGHRLATRCDTEVLVHLYEEYGRELVHALDGMYAFAVWDVSSQELLIARDRFGEKPLFYCDRSHRFAFASEMEPLRVGLGLPADLDPAALDAYFVLGYVPWPLAMIREIRQLPPGHLLVRDQTGEVRISAYWKPPRRPAVPQESFRDTAAQTGEALRASVRSRMIADVPLGVLLSGGVDSTLVAGIAAQASSLPIKTYTVGYDVGDVNELAAAERVARALGADHHALVLRESDIARLVPLTARGLDQPLADQALVASRAVASLARKDVTVAVGGEGADELFGGYPRYRWLDRAGRIDALTPRILRRVASAGFGALPMTGRKQRAQFLVSTQEMRGRHLDWVSDGRRHLRGQLYGPGMTAEEDSTRLLGADDRCEASVAGQLMELDQAHWLPDDVLAKADRASMAVSLEVRTPYLSRELAELAGTIPARVHLAHGGKSLLRALLPDIVPDYPRHQAKTAFRVPASDWLRRPLAGQLREQVEDGELYRAGLFHRTEVRRFIDAHVSQGADHSGALWPLLMLGIWFDRVSGRT